jgi:hypothetical protein
MGFLGSWIRLCLLVFWLARGAISVVRKWTHVGGMERGLGVVLRTTRIDGEEARCDDVVLLRLGYGPLLMGG